MEYEVGSEYIVTKEMTAIADKEEQHRWHRLDRTIRHPQTIEVGTVVELLNTEDPGRVRFACDVEHYTTFHEVFEKCTRRVGPGDAKTERPAPKGE